MKKTYKNPELEVIKIQTQQMLANSVTVDVATGEFSGDFNAKEDGFDWTDEGFNLLDEK